MAFYFDIRRKGTSGGAWFLPHGVSLDDVFAAFQFKGQSSQTEALKDLTGHGRNLTKAGSVTWDAATGFHVLGTINTGLTNSAINGAAIQTIAVRYENVATGNNVATLANPSRDKTLWAKTGSMARQYVDPANPNDGTYNRKNFSAAPGMRYSGQNYYAGARSRVASATIIGVWQPESGTGHHVYVNGVDQPLTYLEPDWGNAQYVQHGTTLGNGGLAHNTGAANNRGYDVTDPAWAEYDLISAAFLTVALTADQAIQMSDMMNNQ